MEEYDKYTMFADHRPRHRSVAAILPFFKYEHLPAHLQAVSRPVGDMAISMADALPECPELTVGLRKLLEAKDCLVRAKLSGD